MRAVAQPGSVVACPPLGCFAALSLAGALLRAPDFHDHCAKRLKRRRRLSAALASVATTEWCAMSVCCRALRAPLSALPVPCGPRAGAARTSPLSPVRRRASSQQPCHWACLGPGAALSGSGPVLRPGPWQGGLSVPLSVRREPPWRLPSLLRGPWGPRSGRRATRGSRRRLPPRRVGSGRVGSVGPGESCTADLFPFLPVASSTCTAPSTPPSTHCCMARE